MLSILPSMLVVPFKDPQIVIRVWKTGYDVSGFSWMGSVSLIFPIFLISVDRVLFFSDSVLLPHPAGNDILHFSIFFCLPTVALLKSSPLLLTLSSTFFIRLPSGLILLVPYMYFSGQYIFHPFHMSRYLCSM